MQLTELLADNTHENWAKQRILDGWKPGNKRNDTTKEHPCLIPYNKLPESEKEYDRNTALEALKVILALGYRIVSPTTRKEYVRQKGVPSELTQFLGQLHDPAPISLVSLLGIWQSRNSEWWGGTSEIFQLLAKRMLDLSEPLFAYDILSESLEHWPNDSKLNRILAHALIKTGETERANNILRQLVKVQNVR